MTADSSKNLLLLLHLIVRMSETLTEILHPCVPQGIFTQVQLSEVWIANENRGKISANSLWASREKTSRQPGKKERHRIGHSIPYLKNIMRKENKAHPYETPNQEYVTAPLYLWWGFVHCPHNTVCPSESSINVDCHQKEKNWKEVSNDLISL